MYVRIKYSITIYDNEIELEFFFFNSIWSKNILFLFLGHIHPFPKFSS